MHCITADGMCRIGNMAVPLRMFKKRMVQSLLQSRTYLAHKQKFTTGEPMNVSHSSTSLLRKLVTLHIGPASVVVYEFSTCKSDCCNVFSWILNFYFG